MTLVEAIHFLEEYYTKHSLHLEFDNDEIKKMRVQVEEAFKITDLEWQEELLNNTDFTFVSFSKIYNCLQNENDTIRCFKGNIFVQAIVPKVCAKIWASYFNEANFYTDGEKLYADAKKELQLEDYSLEIKHFLQILNEIEQSGYGVILRNVNQKIVAFLEEQGFLFEIRNVEGNKPLCQFVTMEDGTVRFMVLYPLFKDTIMNIADKKFNGVCKGVPFHLK